MKKLLLAVVGFVAFSASVSASALDLQTARSQGLVGEQKDGFVATIKDGEGVSKLVNEINALRQKEYQRISGENGQPVNVVAKVASGQIVSNLPSGSYYKDDSDNWVKK